MVPFYSAPLENSTRCGLYTLLISKRTPFLTILLETHSWEEESERKSSVQSILSAFLIFIEMRKMCMLPDSCCTRYGMLGTACIIRQSKSAHANEPLFATSVLLTGTLVRRMQSEGSICGRFPPRFNMLSQVRFF